MRCGEWLNSYMSALVQKVEHARLGPQHQEDVLRDVLDSRARSSDANAVNTLVICFSCHGREGNGAFEDEIPEGRADRRPDELYMGQNLFSSRERRKGIRALLLDHFGALQHYSTIVLVFAQCYGEMFANSVRELEEKAGLRPPAGCTIRIHGLSRSSTVTIHHQNPSTVAEIAFHAHSMMYLAAGGYAQPDWTPFDEREDFCFAAALTQLIKVSDLKSKVLHAARSVRDEEAKERQLKDQIERAKDQAANKSLSEKEQRDAQSRERELLKRSQDLRAHTDGLRKREEDLRRACQDAQVEFRKSVSALT